MKISEIAIKNFRLLEDVSLRLESDTTLIVGRNNCGKTSLTELFRRLLAEGSPKFRLEDFSLGVHEKFWKARELFLAEEEKHLVRECLPIISITLAIEYSTDADLGTLSHFIVDLDETCMTAKAGVTYALAEGKIEEFFSETSDDRHIFFREMRERIPKMFEVRVEAQDPNDSTNVKNLEVPNLRSILQLGLINAQRALDDTTTKEKAVLGKIFERLFNTAASAGAGPDDKARAAKLKTAVGDVQTEIDANFNKQLSALAPTFELFGYPGLSDPQLQTETQFDVQQLLSNHTIVTYLGSEATGINLPESYNGLGSRNLIFILLKLFEHFREFTSRRPLPGINLIFIEEPEAHLHPQMQSVFIKQLNLVRKMFETTYNAKKAWPVQFVVTTHSSHIANEASFDAMRYFLAKPREVGSAILRTSVKALRDGLGGVADADRKFLHKYMTLTRCDLLFTDCAVLVEGPTERILFPALVEKFDQASQGKLGGKYMSIIEVGGAYANLFYNLLDFLEQRTLVLTDLDSVNANDDNRKCKVSQGTHSSNSSINAWFSSTPEQKSTLADLLRSTDSIKTKGSIQIAFQVPHVENDACGRSFEDAFMLANPNKFQLPESTKEEREEQSWALAKKVNKTEFALKYAINETDWVIPRYIEQGLLWLGQVDTAKQGSFS